MEIMIAYLPSGIRKYIENWEPVSVIKVIPDSSHIPFLTNPDDFL